METPTGRWIAELILAHIDELAVEVATIARQTIPLYASLPPDVVKQRFVESYQAQAQTFAQGSMEPLRAYMEPTITARIQSGADAASLIQLVTVLHDGVRRLIEQDRAANPARANEAVRQVETVNKNLRLMFSEINLRYLTKPPKPPA